MTTNDHQYIPLNKLVPWDGNVRKTAGAGTGMAELAASIAAHGVLQSLVVRDAGRGKYAVIAGGRRLQALSTLAKAGTFSAKALVPCHVINGEVNATEIGLAENAVREQMHPADAFEAFRKLADEGLPITDIAARFGVSDTVVRKRLRLARVSPVIVEAYRRGELSLEQVMAFAVSEDHAAQERVWEGLPAWDIHPEGIRDALTEGEIDAADRRVKFVGLKAYEKAGGATRRDLFSEGDNGVFILDPALLGGLVARKLEKAAKAIRKEGWKWVEVRPEFNYEDWSECERLYSEPAPLSDAESVELASLNEEADALSDQATSESEDRLAEIDERIEALQDREDVWSPETLATAGAVVSLGYRGEAEVKRGFVLPEDAIPDERAPEIETGDEPTGAPPFSSALIESLTAEKSAAITAVLMDKPDVALAALVHALALPTFYKRGGATALEISGSPQSLRRVPKSRAAEVIEATRAAWEACIPGEAGALWDWCLSQDQKTLLGLLAFCAALTVNAVRVKTDRAEDGRFAHANALISALLDVARWFTPTAENFFSRVSKPQILSALEEVRGAPPAPAWSSLKKADLASLAEAQSAGTDWLPEVLRSAA
ncbi:MAG TPA: ParB/RepB/Spo0J family partition protein [Bryobacteraceae bacterium]|jgi:ParB family chromosome partitioning protein